MVHEQIEILQFVVYGQIDRQTDNNDPISGANSGGQQTASKRTFQGIRKGGIKGKEEKIKGNKMAPEN